MSFSENQGDLTNVLSWATDQDEFVQCDDGTHFIFTGTDDDVSVVYTSQPIPRGSTQFYYEVQVLQGGTNDYIALGLSTSNTLRDPPGLSDDTVGFYGGDGKIYKSGNIDSASQFTTGDTLGCHVRRIVVDNNTFSMFFHCRAAQTRKNFRAARVFLCVPGLKLNIPKF